MKLLVTLFALPAFLAAQTDPALKAYRDWEQAHRSSSYADRAKSLLETSGEWVAKWPDSALAWEQRRSAILQSQSRSAELWLQVDQNLVRLKGPHTFASIAAYDWVAAHVNLKEARDLISSEIRWIESDAPSPVPNPTLAYVIDERQSHGRVFAPLCTLASAQIQLRDFAAARGTILRIRTWLDTDFKRYYDQDPLETFPDHQSKYFILSAQLAEAEGRKADALAFFQQVITNPYFRREYMGFGKQARALWDQMGGTEEGWASFSAVQPLPAGVPSGQLGISFSPWLSLDYALPDAGLDGPDSRVWNTREFDGKTTYVYLWASWCGPCWPTLPAIQTLYDTIKNRRDIQVITLSADEDAAKLTAFMKDKGYTFPVMVSKAYVDKLLPCAIMGQAWIVDKTHSIRLQRTFQNLAGRSQMLVDEAIYKLTQLSHQASQ